MPNKIKTILTVDDLFQFFENQKFARFSSKESGYQLAVKIPTTFEVENTVDENHRDMLKIKIRVFHTGVNRNHSHVSKESAEKAMKTIPDRPVLAAIHQLSNGDYDFAGHEIEIVHNDKTGEDETHYIESQVGSFSSEPAFWEHDDELDKDYVCAYAYISREYTKASSIIERKGFTKNSCELFIDELVYDTKLKCLDLIDFYVSASTLLGTTMDGNETPIDEGMLGSRADIVDFSVQNNSVKFNKDDKLIEVLDKLNTTLSEFNNINSNSMKGGNGEGMNKFEELLAKYNKTAEDITFDYTNLSDEELEAEFEKVFAESENDESGEEVKEDNACGTGTKKKKKKCEEEGSDESESEGDEDGEIKEDNACGVKKKKKCEEDDSDENSEGESEGDDSEKPEAKEENACGGSGSGAKKKKKKNSVECESLTRTYEISHEDIRYALYNLLDSYQESDNEWYYITAVYDEYFVYESYNGGKIYGQNYTKDNDVVAFDGGRYTLYKEYLTDEEYAELKSMRSNYAALKEFKETTEKNELHEKREAIINSEKYAVLSEKDKDGEYVNKDFAKLVSEMDNYSLIDLEKEAKVILADFVTENKTFSLETKAEKPSVQKKIFTNPEKKDTKKSRYGNLFSK